MRRLKPRICGACDGLWIEHGESGGGAAVAAHGTGTDGGDRGARASSRCVGGCLGGDPLGGASGGQAASVGRGGDAVDWGTRGVGAALSDARVSGEDVGRVLMIPYRDGRRRSDARSPFTVRVDQPSDRIGQYGEVTADRGRGRSAIGVPHSSTRAKVSSSYGEDPPSPMPDDTPIVPPPSSFTVMHDHKIVLFTATCQPLVRRAGF